MEVLKKVYLTVYSDGTVISSDDVLGYSGKHLATAMVFKLPEQLVNSSYIYTVNFEDETGNVRVGTLTMPDFLLTVPRELTSTSKLKASLVITDETGVVFKSSSVTLNIHSGVELPEDVENRYIGLLEDALSKFYALTEQLGSDDVSRFRGIVSIEKTLTEGATDTYTITYTNNTTSEFTVVNGEDYVLTEQDKEEIAQILYDEYIAEINNTLETRLSGGAE